jgi:hypothetical protein
MDAKILEGPWAWLVGGILVSTWLLGVIHAYTAHSQVSAAGALIIPPYGLYMAVEQMAAHPDAISESDTAMTDALPSNEDVGYIEQCLQKRVVSDQLSLGEKQNEVFCICSGQMLADELPEGEGEYVAEHGKNSPAFMALRRRVSESCLNSARAVGVRDAEQIQ